AWHAEDIVEIGIAVGPELACCFAERFHISAYQLTIEFVAYAAAAIDAQRDLHMAAGQTLFQHAPDLHLQLVCIQWETKLRIKKAMVDGLQGQCKGSSLPCLGLHLRKSGHGSDGHVVFAEPLVSDLWAAGNTSGFVNHFGV